MPRKRKLDYEKVKKLYDNGVPTKDLVKMFGVTRQSILRAVAYNEKTPRIVHQDDIRTLTIRIREQLPTTIRSKRSKEARILQECYDLLMRLL